MALPIDQLRPQFSELFAALPPGGKLVLTAPTGSGKSTRVPVWCLEGGLSRVLVIEPRRLACRTLAGWVARQLDTSLGGRVGFAVRFEQEFGPQTEVLFVTPGVARRMLTEDGLQRFQAVIFDEFHERSWETDTLLALLVGEGFQGRLILMSATLQAQRLAQEYQAQLLESQGRSFPVDISYRHGGRPELTVPTERDLVKRTVEAVKTLWKGLDRGRILVFLPGLKSMTEVRSGLSGLPVYLLHGTFGHAEQDSAFSERPKDIVLATNVAESSLTVPGVVAVVDTGLERRPIHQSGYVALATVPVAQSSADQRTGRAGRTEAGRCFRLWDQNARLEAVRPPELQRMELDELLLFLASMPAGLNSKLHWLEAPPDFAWNRARQRLTDLGLLDHEGRATTVGREVGRLPVDHAWGRVLLLAPEALRGWLCDLCALATARRQPWRSRVQPEQQQATEEVLGACLWRRHLSVLSRGKAERHGLDQEALEQVRKVSRELRAAVGAGKLDGQIPPTATEVEELQLFLARTWPDRFFVRRAQREAWGNGSVECRLPRGEEVSEEAKAVFFLQIEPVVGRGLKVDLQGRAGLPVSFSLLRRADFGELRLEKVRLRQGQVQAKLVWEFAGRVLETREETLEEEPLRRALVELALRGAWYPELKEHLEEQDFYGRLAAEMQGESWSETPESFLKQRLAELGVQHSEDLQLITEEDLHWQALEPECLSELRRAYPREWNYEGIAFRMHFEPRRKLVTMHWRSGPKDKRLNPQHLPRWNGWKVQVEERGRSRTLRG